MAKKPDQQPEEEELESIAVTVGPARGGGSALMSPINKGKTVNVRPSAATVEEMKQRGVTRVSASWDRSKKDGRVLQLTIQPAKPGNRPQGPIQHELTSRHPRPNRQRGHSCARRFSDLRRREDRRRRDQIQGPERPDLCEERLVRGRGGGLGSKKEFPAWKFF
jgi:hypothetical protein